VLTAKAILFLLLGVFASAFLAVWAADLTRRKLWRWPTRFQTLVGFITDFFDTLGIGSFAVTTTLFRLRRTVADERLPGTLTVGHTIPTLAQAFIYITIVRVEMRTLVGLIAASVLGAWVGAGVVTRLPRRGVQAGMGLALLAAALLILGKLIFGDAAGNSENLGVLAVQSVAGNATSGLPGVVTQLSALQQYQEAEDQGLRLDGWFLAAGLVGNVLFGALMTIGIGAYAPIMVMVSLLGMNPKAAFPIMMGSCAFLMPVSGARFIRRGKYDSRAALGLLLAGVPAVLLAAFIVKELPLEVVRWLVVVVVVYTGFSMLRSARSEGQASIGALPVGVIPATPTP
jgi:uncharacterized membrane protein YfcA